jgi:hypothetical protein
MNDNKVLIDKSKYNCVMCNYCTSRNSQYERHLLTAKHLQKYKEISDNCEMPNKLQCICGNVYKYRQGLSKHKKSCCKTSTNIVKHIDIEAEPRSINKLNIENKSLEVMKELMIEMFRSNNELKNTLLEIAKEPKVVNNITNNNTQNTQNNNFNLQMFLNEKCKDAITANQFANNIEVSMSDLQNVGNKGYVEGVSQIIINELRKLDITKRPFHCTDLKREVIYVKDADAWNKDNEDKSKLKVIIGQVAGKNLNKLYEWQAEHPDILILDSDDYDMNHKLLYQSHGGLTELSVLKDKVIKLIAKEIHLDKITNST